MKFNIGDTVKIMVTEVPYNLIPVKKGTIGIVTKWQDWSKQASGPPLDYYVEYPGASPHHPLEAGWWFGEEELALTKPVHIPMTEPDFSLEELEKAAELIGEH